MIRRMGETHQVVGNAGRFHPPYIDVPTPNADRIGIP